jgi:hypothetical protein
MSANSESENRFLDFSESEMVSVTRSPEIEQQSMEQLKALTHRLRQAHGRISALSSNAKSAEKGIHTVPSVCRTTLAPWKKCESYLRRFSALTESFPAAKKLKWAHPAKPNFLATLLSLRWVAKPASIRTQGARHLRGCTQKREKSCLRWERLGKKSAASRRREKWRRRAGTARAEAATCNRNFLPRNEV